MKNWKNWIPSKRRLMQLYAALLYNINLKGFTSGRIFKGDSKQLCVPGLNCYSCPGAVGACPLGSLQGAFSADKSTWFYVGGILLLYCILFGRMICGWFCPFGLIQEWLYKIKTPKLKKGPVTRVLSFLKYAILVFFVAIVPVTYALRDVPLPAFCKYICPAGTFEGGIGLLANKVNDSYFQLLGPLFTWKFLLFISFSVACVFIFRMFCRFICPLGALYGLFNKLSVFGVKVEESKCTHCNRCVGHCKMDIRAVGDSECIACGDCVSQCPTGAIQWKGVGPKREPVTEHHSKARKVTRIVSALLLIGVLVGAFFYAWNDPSNAPLTAGSGVGDLCYEGSLSIVTADGVSEQTVNPAGTGKVTVINFWGTWCGPCVNELPYFDQVAREYGDKVAVVAVHTQMLLDTAPEFVATHYADSPITFAADTEGEGYYALLGGRDTYPYTVVVDEEGVVRQIFVTSLEYAELKAAVDSLL